MKKHFNTTQFLLAIIFIAVTSCQSTETNDEATNGNPKTGFTANPQFVAKQEVKTLEIGTPAPDFKLPGVDGKYYTLEDFKEAEVLIVIFTCNHCPTAQAYEDRIIALAKEYQPKGVQLIAISPNSPLGLMYEELGYSDLNDDFVDMIIRAEDQQFNFPYLYDGDSESASLKYGPVATPHAFVFDKERKLQYAGRIDGKEKPGSGNAEDLRAAIDALLSGNIPEIQETKTFGCSTKWGWKTELKAKVNAEWDAKEVSVSPIDEEGIQALLKNEDSEKLRLINVWATWCGPCKLEYPEFIVLQRMYGDRDFEFISISADSPDKEEKVLKFLQAKYSAIPNFLFSKDDKYALVEAVDKNWNGALPYSILVEPNGKVVWSHQGEVDFHALKQVIVNHPMMGRFY